MLVLLSLVFPMFLLPNMHAQGYATVNTHVGMSWCTDKRRVFLLVLTMPSRLDCRVLQALPLAAHGMNTYHARSVSIWMRTNALFLLFHLAMLRLSAS